MELQALKLGIIQDKTTSSVKKDGDYKVQDISGETKSYNVDLKVTNDGDKVIQTYVFEYKK